MKTNRIKNSISNIIFGVVFRMINVFFPFIIKSFIIWKIGIQYLGLNSLFTSILSVLSLTELGVGSALVYTMYKPAAENDKDKLCSLLNYYKYIYRNIGLIILVIGIIILPMLKLFISGSYPSDVNIYFLFLIYLADTVISYFMFSYKYAILEVYQKNSVESIIHSFISFLLYLSQIIVLMLFSNYYAYAILIPLSTILLNIIRKIVVDRMYPDLNTHGQITKVEKTAIFNKIKALIGHKIGTTIITSADNIVISSFLGLEILAIYGNYYMIINTIIGFVTIFYSSIQASIGNVLVTETKDRITSYFENLTLINGWIVGVSTILFLSLIQDFMKIWMGNELLFSNQIVLMIGIYLYTWLIRRIGLTFKDAGGFWTEDFLKPYIGAIINLTTNIILVNLIGISGVLISTIIVMVFIYFPWETKVLYEKNIIANYKKYVGVMMFLFIFNFLCLVVSNVLITYISINSILGLFFKGIIIILLYVLMLIIFYNKKIKKVLSIFFKKRVK